MSILRPPLTALAYPAGAAAGIDLRHPGARGLRFSGVSSGTGFINLLSGVPGTNANGPTCLINGRIGISINYVAGLNVATSWIGQSTATDTAVTIAAIVQWSANAANTYAAIFSNNTGSADQYAMFAQSSVLMFRQGVTNSTSSLSVADNVPYFLAISGSPTARNYLVKRLDIGTVTTEEQGTGAASVTSTGTYYVGNWGGLSLPTNGSIAAVAYSNRFMSISELRAWSDDPWAFWYPRLKMPALFTTTVATGPFAAFCTPQQDPLATTYMLGY